MRCDDRHSCAPPSRDHEPHGVVKALRQWAWRLGSIEANRAPPCIEPGLLLVRRYNLALITRETKSVTAT